MKIINNKLKFISITYINIVKELKSGNIEFHIYKQERSSKIVLKHIYSSVNMDNIRKEIEEHGHMLFDVLYQCIEYQKAWH